MKLAGNNNFQTPLLVRGEATKIQYGETLGEQNLFIN